MSAIKALKDKLEGLNVRVQNTLEDLEQAKGDVVVFEQKLEQTKAEIAEIEAAIVVLENH
jgi:peptidoglycan hydrolase CwlO-like protein